MLTNLLGCVGFMISAVFAIFLPGTPNLEAITISVLFTLLGAIGFLLGSLLMLPEVQQDALAGGRTAYWYNVVQYLAYQINPCWTAGIRFEWFDDYDGFIVDPTPGPGVFYDLTLGLNYTPTEKVIVRPEFRWDWFDADAGVGPGPFKDGTERNQFMAAVDVIFSF